MNTNIGRHGYRTYHNKKLERSASFASHMAAKKSSQVTACPSCLLKYRSMPYKHKKNSIILNDQSKSHKVGDKRKWDEESGYA